jgi:hypothetical protein
VHLVPQYETLWHAVRNTSISLDHGVPHCATSLAESARALGTLPEPRDAANGKLVPISAVSRWDKSLDPQHSTGKDKEQMP